MKSAPEMSDLIVDFPTVRRTSGDATGGWSSCSAAAAADFEDDDSSTSSSSSSSAGGLDRPVRDPSRRSKRIEMPSTVLDAPVRVPASRSRSNSVAEAPPTSSVLISSIITPPATKFSESWNGSRVPLSSIRMPKPCAGLPPRSRSCGAAPTSNLTSSSPSLPSPRSLKVPTSNPSFGVPTSDPRSFKVPTASSLTSTSKSSSLSAKTSNISSTSKSRKGLCQNRGQIKKKRRSVSFSTTMDIQFFPRPDDRDLPEAWYKDADYKAMKAANRAAVVDVHRRFRAKREENSARGGGGSNSRSSRSDGLGSGDDNGGDGRDLNGDPRPSPSSSGSSNTTNPTPSGASHDNTASDVPSNGDGEDDLDSILTGLERLLTPKIIRKSQGCRVECWNAVLDEQDRQYSAGFNDAEELARVSRRVTEWSSRRARTIGMLNAPKP